MILIIFQLVTQTISSTLHWLGLGFGIRTWAGPNPRRWPWLVGTTVVSAAWLLAIMLLAANNFFGSDVLFGVPSKQPVTLNFGSPIERRLRHFRQETVNFQDWSV